MGMRKYIGTCERCEADLMFTDEAVTDTNGGELCADSELRGREYHVVNVSRVARAMRYAHGRGMRVAQAHHQGMQAAAER